MKAYNFETVLQAETFTEFCFIKDLLSVVGVEQFEQHWNPKDKPEEEAYFEADFDLLRVYVWRLNEEDVQTFSKFSNAIDIIKRYEVNLNTSDDE